MIKKYLTRYNLSRAILYIVVISIVVYFLPRTDGVKLAYEPGRPWIHPLLTAPFDIPVYRDSLSTKALIDSIDATYAPVYKISSEPRDSLASSILSYRQLPLSQRHKLIELIDSIYNRGIVDHETANIINHRSHYSLIQQHVITRHDVSRILTQRQAYSMIDSLVRDQASRHALQQIQLSRLLTPNLSLDTVQNNRLYNELIQPVTAAIGVLQQGERIIDRGDIVTPQLDTILSTYEAMAADRFSLTSGQQLHTLIGQILMALIVMSLVYTFLYIYRRDIYDNLRSLMAIMTLTVGFYVLAVVALGALPLGIFLVPFAMMAILLVVFFDPTTAMFMYLIEILTCACITNYTLEFMFIEIAVGMATIFTMHELSRRSQLLRTAIVVFIVYILSYVAIDLMATATLNTFSCTIVGYFAINMVLITFAYILIFIFEKLFGLISSVTLVELSDINNPLLRQLSEQCPGTFQHSMAVSNLASNAAARIGANVLLVMGRSAIP